MPISKGFNHVATLSTDLDRHAEWWGKVFGATVSFTMDKQPDHPRLFILDVGGGAALNVFEVAEDEIIGERRRQGGRGAIDHFAIAVDSREELEAVKQRLIDVGADIGEIQQLGREWSLFFRDVDGMELEVCAPAD
jgi:catechol 2,3-dioxygenase-like lactoylglutathione lyase family enzyme